MKGKGRVARYKVGPRAGTPRTTHHDVARVPLSAPSHHFEPEPPFRIPSNLLQPLECLFRRRKDWNANRDELRDNRKRARKSRKFERVKIESFFFCPTFLMPRNAKQRRGNCHNPIFTPRIFSGFDMQNEAARTKPA